MVSLKWCSSKPLEHINIFYAISRTRKTYGRNQLVRTNGATHYSLTHMEPGPHVPLGKSPAMAVIFRFPSTLVTLVWNSFSTNYMDSRKDRHLIPILPCLTPTLPPRVDKFYQHTPGRYPGEFSKHQNKRYVLLNNIRNQYYMLASRVCGLCSFSRCVGKI